MPAEVEKIHAPVLLAEVLEYLQPRPEGIYVDGTLGLGGHSLAILQAADPGGQLIAFEWDENAISLAQERLQRFGDRLTIIRRNFAELKEGLTEQGVEKIDGLLVDIGLSSLQLDHGCRGFSFQRDEKLDMRMDTRRPVTAAKLLAQCSEEELADIIYYYGEDKQARRIAAEIVKARKVEGIKTSKQLASLVARAIPKRFHPKKIHVATKTFQGLRIAVNNELENLSELVDQAVTVLRPQGRICVITFHSLEDRIVKRKFRSMDELQVITAKPVTAASDEIRQNPRSRSAKLRVAERL